jgi:DNA-binding NtrC family response regulator
MAVLTAYPWPGNVRELRNALERAATLATGRRDPWQPTCRPASATPAGAAVRVADASRRQLPLRDLERAYILEVLRQTGGNKSRAAEILGLDRKTALPQARRVPFASRRRGVPPKSRPAAAGIQKALTTEHTEHTEKCSFTAGQSLDVSCK